MTKNLHKKLIIFLTSMYGCMWCGIAFSGEDAAISSQLPSVFVSSDAGYTTYQSGVVDSNDASFTVRYTLGVMGGTDKRFSMTLEGSPSLVKFRLNKTTVRYNWQDILFRARWKYFYGGLLLSINRYKSEIDEEAAAEENVDVAKAYDVNALRSGYGINIGLVIPYGKPGFFYLDAFYHTTAESLNLYENGEVTIGPRTQVDFGTRLHAIANTLDVIWGYRVMTISFNIEETGAEKETRKETLSTPYAGLLLILN